MLVALQTRGEFRDLPAATQRALVALLGGRDNPRSQRARDQLATATAHSVDWSLFLTERTIVADVLKRERGLPRLRSTNAVAWDGSNASVSWTTGSGEVAQKTIPIQGSSTARCQHFADYLRAVPPEALALLDRIVIHDQANPDDAYWSKEYGAPVRSAMSNSAAGELNVYPEAFTQDRQTMVKNILHEVGHTWSLRAMGDDDSGPRWAPWRDAIVADGMAPSAYGGLSVAEDAAESFLLWYASRGTAQFADYERMMPNRFAFMRTHLAPSLPTWSSANEAG